MEQSLNPTQGCYYSNDLTEGALPGEAGHRLTCVLATEFKELPIILFRPRPSVDVVIQNIHPAFTTLHRGS